MGDFSDVMLEHSELMSLHKAVGYSEWEEPMLASA